MSIKKGNSSWTPQSKTDVFDKEDGYRYRWARKDPENVYKKQAERWEIINNLQSDKSQATKSTDINEGKNLTSVQEKHDVILMRIKEEDARERDAYFDSENERMIGGLTAHIKKEMRDAGNAPVHGKITISSRRKGEQIYE